VVVLKWWTTRCFVCIHALAQSDDLAALNQRIEELYRAGKNSEAIPLAEKSLGMTRALKDTQHLQTVARASWLASLYQGPLPNRGNLQTWAASCR
jgi:hypothetical protein